ncbi:hypothetical protein EIP86_000104 [Pleurotus ostreatoroseus]|nr:hypothetical protein EIP86_000104 [Pleurotus ostreatoroseus]
MQEQNIGDIKCTFATIGPFATWEGIGKMSAAIPAQRRIKDHVESDINHFRRGKSHTVPNAEADIKLLNRMYKTVSIHENKSRSLDSSDKAKDHLKLGAATSKLKAVIQKWTLKRTVERSMEQNYEGDSTPEGTDVEELANVQNDLLDAED